MTNETELPLEFGRYTLRERIGVGGMGEVFRATLDEGGFSREVCIKRVLPTDDPAANQKLSEMFREEASILARVSHPNVIGVSDFGEVDGAPFLVMEYVDGLDLRALIDWSNREKQPLHPALCARIIEKVARGLQYVHTLEVDGKHICLAQRDVSPDNILLGKNGEVKLLDFGIAKGEFSTDRTAPGVLRGKLGYFSPEQIAGEPTDPRMDQYATGLVLWEALVGRSRFATLPLKQMVEQLAEAKPLAPSVERADVPKALDRVVLKAVARDKEKRFEDMAGFASALTDFASALTDEDIAIAVLAAQGDGPPPIPAVEYKKRSNWRSRLWEAATSVFHLRKTKASIEADKSVAAAARQKEQQDKQTEEVSVSSPTVVSMRAAPERSAPAVPSAVIFALTNPVMAQVRADIERMPGLPVAAMKVVELAHGEEEPSALELTRIISQDAGLAGEVLRHANKAGQAGLVEVRSVRESVVRLGNRGVTRLAVEYASKHLLEGPSGPKELEREQVALRRYIRGCGVAAGALSWELSIARPERALLAGMFAEIGHVLVLGALIEMVKAESVDVKTAAAVASRLGDQLHVDAGEEMLLKWQLPTYIVEVCSDHHDAVIEEDGDAPLTHLVRMACPLAAQALGRIPSDEERTLAQASAQALGLSDEKVAKASHSVERMIQRAVGDLRSAA